MKFLVIQLKMIGDVLASTVICESLAHHFPEASVHMVANENTLPVLENNPFIDKIIVFKDEYRDNKVSLFRFLKSLKKTNYYAVFDALGKIESNLITHFSKSEIKIGVKKWYTSWIYSKTIIEAKQSDKKTPLAITNRLILANSIVKDSNFITYPKIYLSTDEIALAKKSIANAINRKEKKLIMISILGSSPEKTYPAEYMARLLDLICENSSPIILFNYIPHQKEDAVNIYQKCAENTKNCIVLDFYAKTLREFMGILSQCDLLIGNEGGAVNMAKALDVPSFCIFSPFITKDGWHGTALKNHESVHLRDYKPEVFGAMDKNKIKKNSINFYKVFKPELFQQSLLNFLKKHNA